MKALRLADKYARAQSRAALADDYLRKQQSRMPLDELRQTVAALHRAHWWAALWRSRMRVALMQATGGAK